jgi:site-specific recombinase XerD
MVRRYDSANVSSQDSARPSLGEHVEGFCRWLQDRQYPGSSIQAKRSQVRALERWLDHWELELRQLDEKVAKRFVASRRRRGIADHSEGHTCKQLLIFLREGGFVPGPPHAVTNRDPADEVLDDFRRFLLEDRRILEGTAERYISHVSDLLRFRFGGDPPRVDQLQLRDLLRFLLRANRRSPAQVQMTATALRMFGRFLLVRGLAPHNVATGLPRTTRWRVAGLPQRLARKEIQQLLSVPNRGTPVGRRNRAILLLLARLGLRACEVCRLELEDIDWRGGTIRVRRKGGAEERLPLPHEVGEALAAHLQGELPRGPSRYVFLTVRAPRRPLRGALHSVVTRALARTGLARRPGGPHLLRHSLAAELLHRGASLPEVGQILGHRHAQTTEIYAKVRVDALRELAQPWPERAVGS